MKLSCTPKGFHVARQTHLVAGIIVWSGVLLAKFVDPNWIWLAALPGFGLLLDATTGICPITLLLNLLPANKAN